MRKQLGKRWTFTAEEIKNTFVLGFTFGKRKDKMNFILDFGSYSICLMRYRKNKTSDTPSFI